MKWSHSAHASMRRCQRSLVFGHLMASALARDPLRREAHTLKQLQSLSAWQGSLVHAILASRFFVDNLVAGRPVDAAALAAAAQDLARRQYAFSEARLFRGPAQSKKTAGDAYCALHAHEYGQAVPPEALAEVHANLARCFANLAAQGEFLARLRAGHAHQAEVRLNFQLGALGLATVTATLDLVYVRPDGQPTVVDWKIATNETSDYSRQLLVYALAVSRSGRWTGVMPEGIELVEANLLTNRIRRHAVTSQRLDEAEDFVYRSLVELDGLIGNRKFEQLDLDDFEVAERPATCQHCNFASLCLRKLAEAGRVEEMAVVQGRLW